MIGTAGHRRATVVSLLASAAVLFAPAASAPASAGGVNVESTRKLLEARLTYNREIAADVSAMAAAGSAFTSQIARECDGILALAEKHREAPATAPKRFGEEIREQEQAEILERELQAAIEHAVLAPVNPVFAAYRQTLLALPWEDPKIEPLITAGLQRDAEELAPPPPICADASAWVTSGYQRLSESTKSFLTISEAHRNAPVKLDAGILERFETHAERSLVARLDVANAQAVRALEYGIMAAQGARSAIGVPHSRDREAAGEGEAETVSISRLARGRTAAGTRYFATVEAHAHARRCKFEVAVIDAGRREGETERCVGHIAKAALTVPCFERERPVLALLPADVRSVRLVLADGHTITSRTVPIPRRLGGPAALYYQGVPVSEVPSTLAELDAHGRTLDAVAVPRASRCVRHGVVFIPHGIQPLAQLQIPGGQKVSIQGEAFVYKGPIHFGLQVNFSGGGGEGVGMSGAQPKILLDAELNRCYPQPWELVYGVLKTPGARVLARTPGGETPLARAPIPKHLHAGGVLVYGVFTEPLQNLVVEDAQGRQVLEEGFAKDSKYHEEYCEGFLEPGRAPQQDTSLF